MCKTGYYRLRAGVKGTAIPDFFLALKELKALTPANLALTPTNLVDARALSSFSTMTLLFGDRKGTRPIKTASFIPKVLFWGTQVQPGIIPE